MAGPHAADLERTRLCAHGPEHAAGHCMFAHSLLELRRPHEAWRHYTAVWDQGQIHRWYGQAMTPQAMGLFERYWDLTPVGRRPLWAIGLYIIELRAECFAGMSYPWDFGLESDLSLLCRLRGTAALPFRFYDNLWVRLEARRAVELESLIRRPLPSITDSEDPDDVLLPPEELPIPHFAAAVLVRPATPRGGWQ